MKKFSSLYFNWLPNAAHFAFFEERFSSALASAGADVQNALAAIRPEFDEWLDKETAMMDWQHASEYTQQIADAARATDHDLASLKAQVRAAVYSNHAEVAAAALRIRLMFHNYGYVAKKPYETKAGDLNAILDRLNGDLMPDVQTVNVSDRVMQLQADFATFNTLFNARNAERAVKPALTFREVRLGIEGVYRRMTAIVEANLLVGASPQFAAFAAGMKPEIDYLNAHYRHNAKTDLGACQPEPIPAQAYTGIAVTPVPRVFLETKKGVAELVNGKDFYFEYANNVEVGNADCIVRGIGRYRGGRKVTFLVERN